MKNTRRFTLIELLAVVALIAVLSTIGFGAYSYAKGKARESATEALVKQIEAGLGNFHTRNGYYPKSSSGNFSPIKLTFNADGTVKSVDFGGDVFTRQDISSTSTTGKKLRMENERLEAFTKALDLQVIKGNLNTDGEVTDAWGNKIYYRSPGVFKPGNYDLVSAGADGGFGQSRETTPTGTLSNFRETAGEHVCDDIFNF